MGKKVKDRRSSSSDKYDEKQLKISKERKYESESKDKLDNNQSKPTQLDSLDEEDQLNKIFGIKEFDTTKVK